MGAIVNPALIGLLSECLHSHCTCCIRIIQNTLRLRQKWPTFADDILKCMIMNENDYSLIRTAGLEFNS